MKNQSNLDSQGVVFVINVCLRARCPREMKFSDFFLCGHLFPGEVLPGIFPK